MSSASQVSKLYNTVVIDVINNVKEAFLDEGVDEQVLQELKQLWESKLASSKALEPPPVEPDVAYAHPPGVPVMLPQPIQSASQQRAVPSQPTPVRPTSQFQPSGATAIPPGAIAQPQIALPSGLFSQQITTLGAGGQMQNITVQQTGNRQYISVAGLTAQQIPQFQQQIQLQQQQLASQGISSQPGQQIQIQHPVPQQPKLISGAALLQQQQQQQQLQQQQGMPKKGQTIQGMIQLDGNGDTSSSDDEDLYDDDKEEEAKEDENEEEDQGEEEEPLNSEDDVSEDDPTELFDSENVVVCQYDKINRNKNKWKFHLKDGIMNLNGRDYVFQKAIGDSEW